MGAHAYAVTITWTGNKGEGTTGYADYERSHTITAEQKVDILGSSDTPFRGDKTRHNPEDMLLASLSSCHMLWYLHLCADAGVIVMEYIDKATGTMVDTSDRGCGHFTEVVLHPEMKVTEEWMIEKAIALHDDAHKKCFIANSVNFPVLHKPVCKLWQKAETV
ncbi:MAG: OsmC family peroxiredoxin [Sphingobacteriales bacterium]|nr:MAG: OsmC family peroxiredoxin [Sphingobacteriales bacterium]